MKNRPLFVFAGQSNMMGAAVYPSSEQIYFKDSYEYLHKPRRMGASEGVFKQYGFPAGEFSYRDLQAAYGEATLASIHIKSGLANYATNTLFGSSMCNLKDAEQKLTEPFSAYSEKNVGKSVSLPPFWAQELENAGYCCAYTHIAKGAVAIKHYFNENMIIEYNRRIDGYGIPAMEANDMTREASAYFAEKTAAFFEDCAKRFAGDDMSVKALVWLQGESDASSGYLHYKTALSVLWENARKLGFTHFFCVRVDYFGNPGIVDVMKAQEDFCKETPDAYIITRACSFMTYAGQDDLEWFIQEVPEEYHECRDSFYGYANQHINEKGFRLIASRSVDNFIKLVTRGEEPKLEPELIRRMIEAGR